jgi:hypothetical protein
MGLKKYKQNYDLNDEQVITMLWVWIKTAIKRSLGKMNKGIHLESVEIEPQILGLENKKSCGYLDLSLEDVFQDAAMKCLESKDGINLQNAANRSIDRLGRRVRRQLAKINRIKRDNVRYQESLARNDASKEIRIFELKDGLDIEESLLFDAVIYFVPFDSTRQKNCYYVDAVIAATGFSEHRYRKVRERLKRKLGTDFYLSS